jgi:predicted metal-dependent HD superfamily phosphohydrolase
MNERSGIVQMAAGYLDKYLEANLPEHFYFHNIRHTTEVKEWVLLIGDYLSLSKLQLELLQLAAIFHDIGYCNAYIGHEVVSVQLAGTWLKQQSYPDEYISKVVSCIAATHFPQYPVDILGKVICDADLAHFASIDYCDYESRLRKEWEAQLLKFYTDEEWAKLNCGILRSHRYFTSYGIEFLQPGKEKNIDELSCRF